MPMSQINISFLHYLSTASWRQQEEPPEESPDLYNVSDGLTGQGITTSTGEGQASHLMVFFPIGVFNIAIESSFPPDDNRI